MSGFFLTALLTMAMAPMQSPSTTQTAASAASSDSPTTAHRDVPASATVSTADLAPTDPVITIRGLCTGAASAKPKSSDCATVVTKQQFDAVVSSLNSLG